MLGVYRDTERHKNILPALGLMLSATLEHVSSGEHFSFLNCMPERFLRSKNWILDQVICTSSERGAAWASCATF